MRDVSIGYEVLEEVIQVLSDGRLLALPTDTVWGLVGKADDERAYHRMLSVKGYEEERPFQVLVDSYDSLERWVVLELEVREVLRGLEGVLGARANLVTVVLPVASFRKKLFVGGDKGKLGVRVTNSRLLRKLIEILGVPLLGSSANLKGKPVAKNLAEVRAYFEGNPEVFILNLDVTLEGKPSTVVEIPSTGTGELVVLREGALSLRELKLV